jgi:cobalt-zinc-cadmium efflux system outer membrane protein
LPIHFPSNAAKKPTASRLFFALTLSFSLPAIALAQDLTADEAVRMAFENAENRALIDSPVEAAEGQLESSRTWRNPVLEIEREGADGFGGDGSETFVRVEREFDWSGRRALEARGAAADVEAAVHASEIGRAELRAATLRAFYALLAAEAEQAAFEGLGTQFNALERATQRRVEAGDASQLELERVRQETLRLSAMAADLDTAASQAEAELYIAAGIDMRRFGNLSGVLLPAMRADAADRLVMESPRLTRLEAEVDAAEAREDAAGRIAPDVALGLGVRHTEGMGGETGLLFSASVPLPLFDRNQGERRSRAADARLADARVRVERRRLEADYERLRHQAISYHRISESYEAEALASARELQRISLVSYRGGEIGVLEAIDGIQTAYEAEIRAISLQHRAREAVIALEELLAETE